MPLIRLCSSRVLLQDLLFEDAFGNLNPRSLEPYLERFEATEDLQNFLDIANACIAAAKAGRGKPIQNPHGFLLAQLRAGYINPPEGYKAARSVLRRCATNSLRKNLRHYDSLKSRSESYA